MILPILRNFFSLNLKSKWRWWRLDDLRAISVQCCQKVPAENPHSIYQKSPLVPTKVSSQKSPHFAKISPLFLKIPTIFEKNPNILLKFLQFFQKIPTFCKNSPLFSKFFKNFNPHLKKMVPTKPLKIPTVEINPHFRQHCAEKWWNNLICFDHFWPTTERNSIHLLTQPWSKF